MPAVITKSFILDEIRRTADANGGKPLGSAAFRTETGIRASDWKGRYWARWSDALSEAGFIPNEFTSAIDINDLAQFYACLANELGHLPVEAELALKRRSTPEFPSDKTFWRLGGKEERIRVVAEFCQANPGYEDVLGMCQEFLASTVDTDESDDATENEIPLGYVYLLKSGRFHKIGRSNAAGRREYEIGLQLPEKLTSVHVITTDDPSGIEAYWHKRFETKRKNGEWFDLDRADVSAFKRRKFM